MKSIVCVVEGHGEVRAVPVLLRRLAERCGTYDLSIPEPIRSPRDRLLHRDEEFRRVLGLASLRAGAAGLILVVLDADDDCPVELGRFIESRAKVWARDVACRAVLANREYEAWLLAAAPSLASRRGLPGSLEVPEMSETIRNAKGWLSERMVAHGGSSYSPVLHQAALTAVVDLDQALVNSRSLRRLEACVSQYLAAP